MLGKFRGSDLEIKEKMKMVDKLVEIKDLMELLGYTDERSILAWCKKNRVPLFHIGKKTYTISNFIDLFISEQLEHFVKANYDNADSILSAIKNDDKGELSRLVSAPIERETKERILKKADSKDAVDFISKLKAA